MSGDAPGAGVGRPGRKRLLIVLAVVVAVLAIAYGLFWKFYLRSPVEPELTLPPLSSAAAIVGLHP